MYKHPSSLPSYLNTWTLILAPSGANKSTSKNLIQQVIPKDPEDNKIIKTNFESADGSAAFITELAKVRVQEDNFGEKFHPVFWIEDEYAQFMKKLLPNGSMVETRKTMLKIHDYEKASRITRNETVETEKLVMTGLFLNTIDSFARTFDEESLNDGLGRRHNFIYAERDERVHPEYLFDEITANLKEPFEEFFNSVNTNIVYTFEEECRNVYNHFYIVYKEKFDRILGLETNGTFFRTYFMLSWKYAVIYHILLKEEGTIVKAKMMDYGIKVSLMFLTSIKRFLDYKIDMRSGQNKKG